MASVNKFFIEDNKKKQLRLSLPTHTLDMIEKIRIAIEKLNQQRNPDFTCRKEVVIEHAIEALLKDAAIKEMLKTEDGKDEVA